MSKLKYEDRHKIFPDTIIISYPLRWGGQFLDRRFWLAELNGGVWDYNPKATLISDAIESGFDYVVLRSHRDGTTTIQESNLGTSIKEKG